MARTTKCAIPGCCSKDGTAGGLVQNAVHGHERPAGADASGRGIAVRGKTPVQAEGYEEWMSSHFPVRKAAVMMSHPLKWWKPRRGILIGPAGSLPWHPPEPGRARLQPKRPA